MVLTVRQVLQHFSLHSWLLSSALHNLFNLNKCNQGSKDSKTVLEIRFLYNTFYIFKALSSIEMATLKEKSLKKQQKAMKMVK